MSPAAFVAAVGRLVPDGATQPWQHATGFVLTAGQVITARHVLCHLDRPPVQRATLHLAGGIELELNLRDHDPHLDIAILDVLGPLPTEVDALWLAPPHVSPASLHRGVAVGWPHERSFVNDIEQVGIELVSASTTIHSGAPAWKLRAAEAAQDGVLKGISGAPVCFRDVSAGLPGVEVVHAVMRWNPPRADGGPAGGVVFATPAESIVARWPKLAESAYRIAPPAGESSIDQFLAAVLGEQERPVPFGGRSNELEEIRAWHEDPTAASRLLVVAPSGMGKSSLLARYWSGRKAVSSAHASILIPISIRHGLATEERVLRALASRLAVLYGHNPSLEGIVTSEQLRDLIARLLSNASDLLIVIDGLDEAFGWEPTFALPLPRTLPIGVRLIASARATQDRPNADAWRDALRWPAESTAVMSLGGLDRNDVLDAVRSLTPSLSGDLESRIADRLAELSGGDPLVVGLHLQDIQEANDSAAAVQYLLTGGPPPGLEGYIEAWWQDQELQWGEKLASRRRSVTAVLNLLSLALAPLTRRDLLTLLRFIADITGDELDQALSDLRRWVVPAPPGEGFTLSHPRMAEFRVHRLRQDGDSAPYISAFSEWGARVMGEVAAGSMPDDASPYIVRFYGAHLVNSDADPSEVFRLTSALWRELWLRLVPDFQGYPADIRRAYDSAARSNRRQIEQGLAPRFVAEQAAATIAAANASVEETVVSAQLAAALAARGAWGDEQILSYLASRTNPAEQAGAVGELGGHLSAAASQALQSIVTRLRSRDDPALAADALFGWFRYLLRTSGADECLRSAAAIHPDAPGRATAIARLCAVLPDAPRATAARWALSSVPDDERFAVLDQLTASLSVEEAEALIASIGGDTDPATAVLELLGAPLALGDPRTLDRHADAYRLAARWMKSARRLEMLSPLKAAINVAQWGREELDAEIEQYRRAKEAAIDRQAFEVAAKHRDREADAIRRYNTLSRDQVLPKPRPETLLLARYATPELASAWIQDVRMRLRQHHPRSDWGATSACIGALLVGALPPRERQAAADQIANHSGTMQRASPDLLTAALAALCEAGHPHQAIRIAAGNQEDFAARLHSIAHLLPADVAEHLITRLRDDTSAVRFETMRRLMGRIAQLRSGPLPALGREAMADFMAPTRPKIVASLAIPGSSTIEEALAETDAAERLVWLASRSAMLADNEASAIARVAVRHPRPGAATTILTTLAHSLVEHGSALGLLPSLDAESRRRPLPQGFTPLATSILRRIVLSEGAQVGLDAAVSLRGPTLERRVSLLFASLADLQMYPDEAVEAAGLAVESRLGWPVVSAALLAASQDATHRNLHWSRISRLVGQAYPVTDRDAFSLFAWALPPPYRHAVATMLQLPLEPEEWLFSTTVNPVGRPYSVRNRILPAAHLLDRDGLYALAMSLETSAAKRLIPAATRSWSRAALARLLFARRAPELAWQIADSLPDSRLKSGVLLSASQWIPDGDLSRWTSSVSTLLRSEGATFARATAWALVAHRWHGAALRPSWDAFEAWSTSMMETKPARQTASIDLLGLAPLFQRLGGDSAIPCLSTRLGSLPTPSTDWIEPKADAASRAP